MCFIINYLLRCKALPTEYVRAYLFFLPINHIRMDIQLGGVHTSSKSNNIQCMDDVPDCEPCVSCKGETREEDI